MGAIAIQTGSAYPEIMWTPDDAVTDCGQHTIILSDSATDGAVDLCYGGPFPTNKSRLLFYDRSGGEGEFYATDGDGGMSQIGLPNTDWRTTWSSIVPGYFGGSGPYTSMLFYNPVSGQGEFWVTNGEGSVEQIGATNTDWRTTWSLIVPGYFGGGHGFTDLLFYDPVSGQGEFWATDGHGNVHQIGATNTGWRPTWSLIIPGFF